jgi:hypothetical protein
MEQKREIEILVRFGSEEASKLIVPTFYESGWAEEYAGMSSARQGFKDVTDKKTKQDVTLVLCKAGLFEKNPTVYSDGTTSNDIYFKDKDLGAVFLLWDSDTTLANLSKELIFLKEQGVLDKNIPVVFIYSTTTNQKITAAQQKQIQTHVDNFNLKEKYKSVTVDSGISNGLSELDVVLSYALGIEIEQKKVAVVTPSAPQALTSDKAQQMAESRKQIEEAKREALQRLESQRMEEDEILKKSDEILKALKKRETKVLSSEELKICTEAYRIKEVRKRAEEEVQRQPVAAAKAEAARRDEAVREAAARKRAVERAAAEKKEADRKATEARRAAALNARSAAATQEREQAGAQLDTAEKRLQRAQEKLAEAELGKNAASARSAEAYDNMVEVFTGSRRDDSSQPLLADQQNHFFFKYKFADSKLASTKHSRQLHHEYAENNLRPGADGFTDKQLIEDKLAEALLSKDDYATYRAGRKSGRATIRGKNYDRVAKQLEAALKAKLAPRIKPERLSDVLNILVELLHCVDVLERKFRYDKKEVKDQINGTMELADKVYESLRDGKTYFTQAQTEVLKKDLSLPRTAEKILERATLRLEENVLLGGINKFSKK